MIQLATPISHLFQNPHDAQQIASHSDCLECREKMADYSGYLQSAFHFDIELIHNWSDETRTYLKRLFREKPELELISFHAAACCDEPVLVDRVFQPGGKILSRKEMLDNARQNTNWLQNTAGSHIDIAVENNNYYPTPAYDIVTEGSFLTEIVENNKVKFLFDIAHAMVTAHNRSESFATYRSELPLEAVIQLHICKPDLSAETGYDTHERPDQEILDQVRELVGRYSIRFLTVEYYKDLSVLLAVLKEIRTLFTGN